MAESRPVFLNLLQIRLPIQALLSVAHRASGLALVLLLPLTLYLMDRSLADPDGFRAVQGLLDGWPAKVLLLLIIWGALHHLFSGIRYILIDFDYGVELGASRNSAWVVMISALAAALIAGVFL